MKKLYFISFFLLINFQINAQGVGLLNKSTSEHQVIQTQASVNIEDLCDGATEDVVQNLNEVTTGATIPNDLYYYQSFIAVSNLIGGVSLEARDVIGSVTVNSNLLDALPATVGGGNVLGSSHFCDVTSNGTFLLSFDPPVSVVPGNTYVLEFNFEESPGGDMEIAFSSSDPYIDGVAGQGAPQNPPFFISIVDLTFTLYGCPPPPIPTLSQWGVIALGMLSMIFGVVMIRQRKVIFG